MRSIVENHALHDRERVFRDRADAGEQLAALLRDRLASDAVVCAVPAGGVPVAVPLARALGLRLELCVVSKITLPWNTEVGYGAVAFDGSVLLNDRMIELLGLAPEIVDAGIEHAREKVARRVATLRGSQAAPDVAGHTTVVVDDGLASGFTLRAAIAALKGVGARTIVVAVPTAQDLAALALGHEVDEIACPNLRGGPSFAVADAYQSWRDVSDHELAALL
jgi:predicted phosphoribosyltransferase